MADADRRLRAGSRWGLQERLSKQNPLFWAAWKRDRAAGSFYWLGGKVSLKRAFPVVASMYDTVDSKKQAGWGAVVDECPGSVGGPARVPPPVPTTGWCWL